MPSLGVAPPARHRPRASREAPRQLRGSNSARRQLSMTVGVVFPAPPAGRRSQRSTKAEASKCVRLKSSASRRIGRPPGDVLCTRLAAGPAAAAAAIASADGSAPAPPAGDEPSALASSAAISATLAATPALAARTGRECATACAPRRGESRGSWPLVADTGTVTGTGSG